LFGKFSFGYLVSIRLVIWQVFIWLFGKYSVIWIIFVRLFGRVLFGVWPKMMQSYKQKMRIYAKIVNKIEEGISKFKDSFLLVIGHNILFLRNDL